MFLIRCLALSVSIIAHSYSFGQIQKNDSKGTCNIKFELPDDYSVLARTEQMREQYQSTEGCAFGYDIGRELNSFQDVEIIAAMTAGGLSGSLSDFELIFHDNESFIKDQRYVMVVYSCTKNDEALYNALFMTSVSGNLVTFSFGCPLNIAETKVLELNEIMESVSYECH